MPVEEIAGGLSPGVRVALGSWHPPHEHLMGGKGLQFARPDFVEPVGINHPIFGQHYRLSPLGLAVRAYLLSNPAPKEE